MIELAINALADKISSIVGVHVVQKYHHLWMIVFLCKKDKALRFLAEIAHRSFGNDMYVDITVAMERHRYFLSFNDSHIQDGVDVKEQMIQSSKAFIVELDAALDKNPKFKKMESVK